jgi:SAM-dependent methyltransferase
MASITKDSRMLASELISRAQRLQSGGHLLAAASCFQSALALGASVEEVSPKLVQVYAGLKLFSHAARAARRAAECPGADEALLNLAHQLEARAAALPDARLSMGINEVSRWTSLSKATQRVEIGRPLRVLDLGGGTGGLHLFIEDCQYVLAEPSVNGLHGANLPFEPKSFDVVVACHVLEHIPEKNRVDFLDSMANLARHRLILLNPFRNERHDERARLEFIIGMTQATWAKEHLECGLPPESLVLDWASQRGFRCQSEVESSVALGLAVLFMEHFAAQAGQTAQLMSVRRYFNTHLAPLPASDDDFASLLISVDINGSHAP